MMKLSRGTGNCLYLRILLLILACFWIGSSSASTKATPEPLIALVIDDIGYRYKEGLEAVKLPGAITYAILPHTPHGIRLAELAYQNHKEIILHLPMEAVQPANLGPGGLTLNMTRRQFQASVFSSLQSVPHIVGINNHMGSLLTRHPGHMAWLMEVLKETGGLYFLDSKTTLYTVAGIIAEEQKVPYLLRDVFLDPVPGNTEIVRKQFAHLLKLAKTQGYAIGIAHPFPSTLEVLRDQIAILPAQGIKLVFSSSLLLKQRRSAYHVARTRATRPRL